jgi:hypothetical protein
VKTRAAAALGLFIAMSWGTASAQTAQKAGREVRPVRATVAPKLDGRLDDAVWSGAPLPAENWVSYNPLRGEPEQQRTRVWMAYDDEAIYFAFRAHDDEPGRIRTTITRRDNAWNDDWVAISLDSSKAGQVAYHMFINPSGIQMDALQTASGEDSAVDWTWQSAGRVDEEGYVVEVRVPLQSIRFRGGDDVRMGVMFFRRNSRLGISWSWPEMRPGQWVFESNVSAQFDKLRQPRLLEVIPSATMSANQSRESGGAWPKVRSRGDLGASVKYGITSTVTLDATVNPDFSQVESDAFQVEVNQRFPTFFSEKRPFFMEGLGLFDLAATGGDGTMRTAVHTRRIIDPLAGGKLTGTSGRQTFAFLSAADESPEGDADKLFTIGRVQRNTGPGQYIGALVTDSEYRGSHNRVAAADLSIRRGQNFRVSGAAIYTDSQSLDGTPSHGSGGHFQAGYNTRRLNLISFVEHFDRGFQMDTAFVNRVGLTRTWEYGEVQFYPDQKKHPWLKRVAPFFWTQYAEDRQQGGDELLVMSGLRFDFTRQGNFRIDHARGHETFAGQEFPVSRTFVLAQAQFLRWLNAGGFVQKGKGIFYDVPFGGNYTSLGSWLTLQPTARLRHNLEYNFAGFHRESGEEVFGVHVVNLRNTYQFNPQFLLRAITQYDSGRKRVLGDFLASYELVPGTVVHAGYGTFYEGVNTRPYEATARAFFFKASYLARF